MAQTGTCEEPGTSERQLIHSAPLTRPAALMALAASSDVTVLDVRWHLLGSSGLDDYRRGHIRGASFVDLDAELAGTPGPRGRHPLPDPDQFGRAMRRHGVRAGRPVCCYDERDSTSAARCWWTLTYFGHQAVSVLDGGLAAWREAGGAIETGEAPEPVTPGDFEPVPGHLLILDADQAGRLARAADGILLDARAAVRYRGETEPVDQVAGHIPGAVSAPTLDNLDASGQWRPADQLRKRFAALGVYGSGAEVGVYCGSGVTAAHEVLALRLAGLDRASLYVGSWSEWSYDATRPVATGPDPG
jgi:thiosulfate/3-mercaptopyruvate sulfurtransferase